MPIYEYACKKCGNVLEVFQKLNERGPKACPKCKGKVERVISHTSFQLKGGGWYKDLYSSTKPDSGKSEGGSDAKGEAKSEASSPVKAEAKGDAKSETKPDAKPAAKTETKPAPKAEPKKEKVAKTAASKG
jgi:putative FmdB family regulatory protein